VRPISSPSPHCHLGRTSLQRTSLSCPERLNRINVDGAMTMRTHINHVLSSCFSAAYRAMLKVFSGNTSAFLQAVPYHSRSYLYGVRTKLMTHHQLTLTLIRIVHKSTDFVGRRFCSTLKEADVVSMLMRSQHGWQLNGCNSTMQSQRCSCVPDHADGIKFPLTMSRCHILDLNWFSRYFS